MRKIITIVCGFVQICVAAQKVERISAGNFSTDVGKTLIIRYEDKTIITHDSCDDGTHSLLNTEKGKIVRKGNSYTIYYSNDNDTESFRREVSVYPDRVEITFRILIRKPISSGLIYYRIHCPEKIFDGAAYDYIAGWVSRKPQFASGIFNYKRDVKQHFSRGNIRYLHLRSKDISFTFDFNPEGPWLCYGGNYSRMWGCIIDTDSEGYRLARIRTYSRLGNLLVGKFIIRAGIVPYKQIHPINQFGYTMDVPRNLVLNFSYDKDMMEYKSCNPKTSALVEWENPDNVKIVVRNNQPFVYKDFITTTNNTNGTLIIKNQPPGLYWLTLTVYDHKKSTGPFTVKCKNQVLVKNVKISAGKYWIKTVPLWITSKNAKISFIGNWKLNALALQLIVGREEDYLFKQPYWKIDLH